MVRCGRREVGGVRSEVARFSRSAVGPPPSSLIPQQVMDPSKQSPDSYRIDDSNLPGF